MKNTLRVLGIIAFVAVMVFTAVSCGDDMGGSGNEIQRIYNELNPNKSRSVLSVSRSVINMESISTDYDYAVLAKFINGYTPYPDHHHISDWDWTGVTEGIIKLMHHGINGDGTKIWVFLTIQNGNHYEIFAGNDVTTLSTMKIGIHEDRTSPGQKWFFKWRDSNGKYNDGSVDGTWVKDSFSVTISGSSYTVKVNDVYNAKGIVSYKDSRISFKDTHLWVAGNWEPLSSSTVINGDYTLSGNKVNFSGFIAGYDYYNGLWTKQ
jgi:hypothetical protein